MPVPSNKALQLSEDSLDSSTAWSNWIVQRIQLMNHKNLYGYLINEPDYL